MRRIAYLAGASLMLASMSVAVGQKKSGAETSLLGIHLYDTGMKVVSVYGTPTTIEAVNIGGTGGGAGGGKSPGGSTGGAPASGGPSNTKLSPSAGVTGPATSGFGFGDTILAQSSGTGQMYPGPGAGGAPDGSPPGPNGPGGKGAGGGPGGGGGADTKVVFTRWVYNRAGCKYGFVLDKFNHVIQIEAIGMSNPRVHTQRGIGFGSSFAQIIKKYSTKKADGTVNAPDGYEISGDTIVVNYLVTNKVAFRLSRLGKDKPQVVTGIAVAAGKL